MGALPLMTSPSTPAIAPVLQITVSNEKYPKEKLLYQILLFILLSQFGRKKLETSKKKWKSGYLDLYYPAEPEDVISLYTKKPKPRSKTQSKTTITDLKLTVTTDHKNRCKKS
jgi:hypothetical protein